MTTNAVSWHEMKGGSSVKKPLLLLVALVGAAAAVVAKRRQDHADAALWREATSDTSR